MTDFVLFNSGTKDNWSKVLNLGKQHQPKVWLTATGDATVYAQKKRDGKKITHRWELGRDGDHGDGEGPEEPFHFRDYPKDHIL